MADKPNFSVCWGNFAKNNPANTGESLVSVRNLGRCERADEVNNYLHLEETFAHEACKQRKNTNECWNYRLDP